MKVPDVLPKDSSLVPGTHTGQLLGLQAYSGHLEKMEDVSLQALSWGPQGSKSSYREGLSSTSRLDDHPLYLGDVYLPLNWNML